jgi:hypothetical protein
LFLLRGRVLNKSLPGLSVATIHSQPFFNRPHLYGSNAGGRPSCGDLDGLFGVACLDKEEAADLFLGLGKRAVGDRQLAVANAQG